MVAELCSFTFEHYKWAISKAKKEGYSFYTFSDYFDLHSKGEAPEKVMLLRHDIHSPLKRALEFAKAEKELGVPASYFVRIHADYNPFEFNNYLRLKQLRDMGNEMGIHSDVIEFAELANENAEEVFTREVAFLEAALGSKIQGVTPHRDFNQEYNSLPFFEKLNLKKLGLKYHGYLPLFVKEMKYVSEKIDGGLTWWEKCFCKYIGEEKKICVLTHPTWWYDKHFHED